MDIPQCHRVSLPRLASVVLAIAASFSFAGCGKSPEDVKAEKAAVQAQTTSRLLVKSNHANATFEATRLPAAGEPAPAPVTGALGQTLSNVPPGKYALVTK